MIFIELFSALFFTHKLCFNRYFNFNFNLKTTLNLNPTLIFTLKPTLIFTLTLFLRGNTTINASAYHVSLFDMSVPHRKLISVCRSDRIILWSTLLTMLFACQFLHAQVFYFDQYSIKEGLPHAEVYDVIQSADLKIWAATEGGVACFNGRSFKNFTTDDGLISNNVARLFEDGMGRIWVSHLPYGINFIRNDSVFQPVGINRTIKTSVRAIDEGRDGSLYFFTDHGVFQYAKDGKLRNLTGSSTQNIHTSCGVYFDDNTLYAGDYSGNVFKINVTSQTYDNIQRPVGSRIYPLYRMFVDNEKNLWIGGEDLYRYRADTLQETYHLGANRIYGITSYTDDKLVFSSEGGGLGFFNPISGEVERMSIDQGLPSNYIYEVIVDHEANLWFATYGSGLIRFRDQSLAYLNDQSGLPSSVINEVIVWNAHTAIATDQGVVLFKNNQIVDTLIPHHKCVSLSIDKNGSLLVATDQQIEIINKAFEVQRRIWWNTNAGICRQG